MKVSDTTHQPSKGVVEKQSTSKTLLLIRFVTTAIVLLLLVGLFQSVLHLKQRESQVAQAAQQIYAGVITEMKDTVVPSYSSRGRSQGSETATFVRLDGQKVYRLTAAAAIGFRTGESIQVTGCYIPDNNEQPYICSTIRRN